MNLLKIIFVITVQFKMCGGENDTPCTDITACNCSVPASMKVVVNCRESGVNISDVCEICTKVKQVQSLDIGKNGLTFIPDSCFGKCTDLEELFMDSNSLSNITKRSFEGLKHVKRLNLNNNHLIKDGKIHDPNLFQHLKGLTELHIQQNVNRTTETGNVTYMYLLNVNSATLGNLLKLYLDGLPNGRFGENFVDLKNIKEVIFSGSAIFNLTNYTFRNIPHIRHLDLSFCNLTKVEADTFEPLKELTLLNLSYNMALGFPTLRNVSYGLRDSRSINILDYSKVYKTFGLTTQINRCDVWYLQNTSLKEIYMNINRMGSIEQDVLTLLPATLNTVFLEDNKLSFGSYALQVGCVKNLTRLELNNQQSTHKEDNYADEIDIVENTIDSSGGCPVNESTSEPPGCHLDSPIDLNRYTIPRNLKRISFRNSNMRYEQSTYNIAYPLKNIVEDVDLSNNIIYQWTDKYIKLKALKYLNLSNNFCSGISSAFFSQCENLETLDASNNKIGPVLDASIFENVKGLRILNISRNWIEKLSKDVFIHLALIELLDLSYNLLENLDFQFGHMVNLSILNLRQNKISSLPIDMLKHMDGIAKQHNKTVRIDLSGNKLDAGDCENLEFIQWLFDHESDCTDINNYTFQTGHNTLSYEKLKETFSHFKKSCQDYAVIIIFSTSFILSMVSIIIGGMLYRFRWRLRYFYYMTKARYNGYVPVKNSDTDEIYHYDVFVSYSTENYLFVTGEMYNQLNKSGLSMCLHQKDFLPGNDIAGNIVQAVRNSKMTLVVLSPAFLKSKWCIYEFNMARMESIYSRNGENIIFVVMYEPVDLTEVSPELRECLESDSYLAYPEHLEERVYFWRMLKHALGAPNNEPIN